MKNLLSILIIPVYPINKTPKVITDIRKSITFFLITLIIFQSCVSTQSVTVDRAIATEKRVRIKTIDENTYVYKKLIEKDGIVYGVKSISGLGLVELDLSYLDIIEVKYYSTGATVALVFVSILAAIVIVVVGVGYDIDDPFFTPI